MSLDLGSAVGRIVLNTSGFTNGVSSAISSLDTLQKKSKNLSGSLSSIGSSLSGVGKSLTKGVTTPIVALGAAAVTASANFEKNMSKVSAISGATGSNLEKLKNKAMEMGAKTKFSASESAQAFQYMAMAGWKTEDMLQGIDGIMNLAAADGLDLATTSDIVTDALTAFGLQASDSGHFADVLAKASSSANTNVSMLGESFKYCAPIAGAMGYSVEDVAVALGIMANSGIKASSAGTALRTMVTNLAKPTDDMAIAMDYLGISLQNDDGSMKSLMEVMNDLRGAFSNCKMPMDEFQKQLQNIETAHDNGDLSDKKYAAALEDLTEKAYGAEGALKAKYAATLAGKTGMSGLLAIVNASTKDWDSLTEAIYNADGTTKKMADTMIDNLSGSITLMKSALEGLAIQFGEILTPTVRNITEHITSLAEKMSKLSVEEKEQIVKIAAIVAAAGPLITIMGKLFTLSGNIVNGVSLVAGAGSKLVTGFTNMREAMALSNAGLVAFSAEAKASAMAASPLGAAIGGITAPVLAVIAAIGALVAAFTYLWKTNEDFRDNITGLWDELVGKFSKFFQGITEQLNQLGFNFKDISEVIMAVWDALCNFIAPVMEGALKSVVNTVSTCLDIVMSVINIFIGLFTGNWKQCLNGFKSLFTTVWNYVVNHLKNILNTMKGVLNVALSWFGTSWKECWNNIVSFFKSIPSKVSSILSNMVSSAKQLLKDMVTKGKESGRNFVNGIVNFVKNLPYNMGNLLGLALGKVITFAVSMASKAKELGSNFISSVISTIKNLPNNLSALFNTVVSKTISFASSMKQKATDAGSKFLTNLINGIKNLPARAKELLDSTIAKVTNFVKSMGTKGINAASKFKTSITEGLSSLPSKMMEIGKNVASGIWNGIVSMKDTLISKVKSFGNGIIDGLKSSLDIHSPSRRAKKEVGEMFAQGVIDGVEAKRDAAKKSSKTLSDEIVKAAKSKMAKLKANNKVSLQDEIDYWARVEDACKNGSKAENEAHKKWLTAKKALNKQIKEDNAKVLSDAEKYWDKQTTYHTKSAEQEAKYWKGVLKKLKKGSDEYLQAYKNYISAKNNIDGEKLSDAEKAYDRRTMLNDMSAKDEAAYWDEVLKTLTEGSDEYYEAYKKYIAAKNNIDSEKLSNAEKTYDRSKMLNDMSAKEEAEYWGEVLKTLTEGSDEYYDVYKKYIDAKNNVDSEKLSNAEKFYDRSTILNDMSAMEEAAYWSEVLKTLTEGSNEYYDVYKRYVDAKNNIDNEKLSNAEKIYDRSTILNAMSANEEALYWGEVLKTLTEGSDEYYKAYKRYIDAKNNIDGEKLSEQEQYLEDVKLYNDVSLKAEMDYWDGLRTIYAEGTEERKQADKNYFDAKEAYQNKLLELEKNYTSEVQRVNEDLNKTVESLYGEYERTIQSRVNSIMGAFKLFEGYTFEEANGNAQDLISNLQSQVDAIETYGNELDKISARGLVPEDMFEELKGLGVDATENLKVINSMTDEELTKYVSLWQQKNSEAVEQAKQELEPLRKSTEDAIAEATKGAEEKLTELKNEFDKNMASINASSSKLANKVGKDVITNIVTGIDSAKSKLNDSLSSITYSISSTLETVKGIASELASAVTSANSSASSFVGGAAVAINGSHKNGLSRVPYDGYIAELHEGERVLTKDEANALDGKTGGSGDTYIFNSPKAIDEKEAARQMKKAKKELALGF